MIIRNEYYICDENGNHVAIVLPLARYRELIGIETVLKSLSSKVNKDIKTNGRKPQSKSQHFSGNGMNQSSSFNPDNTGDPDNSSQTSLSEEQSDSKTLFSSGANNSQGGSVSGAVSPQSRDPLFDPENFTSELEALSSYAQDQMNNTSGGFRSRLINSCSFSTKTGVPIDWDSLERVNGHIKLYFQSKAGLAYGYVMGWGRQAQFVVLKGSVASIQCADSLRDKVIATREKLIADGSIVVTPDYYEFTKDVNFNSSSLAASLIAGNNRSGAEAWHASNKMSLKEMGFGG